MIPIAADFPRPRMSSFHSSFNDPEICRSILESLPSGLCAVDLQRKIMLWSNGAERITGRLRHEVIGHSCISETPLHCDQPDCEFCREDCPIARAIKTSRSAEGIGSLRHKAGHEIPVRICAVPIHNLHGSIIGAVETFEELRPAAFPDDRRNSPQPPGCVDDITGVASHALMQSHLRETLATFLELQVPFGVLCLRLEGLERFRASFGPEAASCLLRMVARTLEGALWKTDFVGRWSNDQFLVILNGCRDEALTSVQQRLQRMLANDAIEWWGEPRSLPISIGQATALPGDTIESLMQRAQQSLQATSTAVAGESAQAAAAGGKPASGVS
jgi:diguanylate cyclase (GGDEF)-like protein/PAS domain S-box-containing protein